MPSWQARIFNRATTLLIRRRSWGDERALAARARRLFGAPPLYRSIATRGVRRVEVRVGGVRGEWLSSTRSVAQGVILYVHGGGYVSCSTLTHRPITAALARLSRRRVLSVDYRLAPEHRFPAAIDDVFAAYQWLLTQIPSAAHVALAGDSAGGGLVLALLQRVRDEGLPLPACTVCFSPLTDFAGTGASAHTNDGRCAMFRPENTEDFAAAYLGNTSRRTPLASPLYGNFRGLPPLLLHVSSQELLLDDAKRVHDAVLAAGGDSELDVFDDVMHCWQMLDGLVPEAHESLHTAAAFVNRHLG